MCQAGIFQFSLLTMKDLAWVFVNYLSFIKWLLIEADVTHAKETWLILRWDSSIL